MNPNERILQVMEYLMAAGSKPVKQVDISRELGLAPATVNRIVKTLSDRGYLLRTSQKYCICNFRLTRNVPMSEEYLSILNSLMNDITDERQVSMEAVVATGFDFIWHSRTELPNATVAIRATTGFRRSIFELDAMSRLYLSRFDWEDVSYKFFPGGFFTSGVEMRTLKPEEARELIEGAAKGHFQCDFDGNHVGVRRFATIIEDIDGQPLHLLSMAEAATPVRDRKAHISEARRILGNARIVLQQQILKEVDTESGSHYPATAG
ncbi:helix-turn-helix domain-containing protein [Marivita sp.]|uniref:helix-turn-helix domain-containing protein n=1 Tax=Marivita sp. TaxID=2003365 RepID=UPI00321979F0